jgi:hypothetical protein
MRYLIKLCTKAEYEVEYMEEYHRASTRLLVHGAGDIGQQSSVKCQCVEREMWRIHITPVTQVR